MKIWTLKKGADRRFRAGHPWVYSNELIESPKGLPPGDPVEIRDPAGKFLARGYGNPASLIAFRAMSRNPEDANPASPEGVTKRLKKAAALRKGLGLAEASHRLCFGEADQVPGLVIDRYLLKDGAQVFAVQAHSAGADRLIGDIEEILKPFLTDRTGIVLRNDLPVRKLEGLQEENPRVLRPIQGVNLEEATILIASLSGGAPLEFEVDLVNGQKTGFFLDQVGNVQLAMLKVIPWIRGRKTVRILDLCTYVGQWSAQMSRALKSAGITPEVVLVDASRSALDRAQRNVESQGAKCEAIKGDVLKDLTQLADRTFDLVISDPPALIKGRKDIPVGTHAYLQLNTQVFRLVKEGGAVVSCSCSALLEERSFEEVLTKAATRNHRSAQWIARGSQSPDHPMLTEFPEGRYLKCWIGVVDGL